MAVTYGFFNSVNGDRKYNADQMSEYFRGIVSQGVFQHLDSGMAVSAGTGLSVSVAAGRAIIQNRWVQNSAALNLTISDASETYGRKDAVVIRLNKSSRAISIAVKTGTPAASPVAPSMTRDETTYEMALAYVNVAAGASSVTVTDKRSDSSVCGWASVAQATSGEVDQMLNDMKTGFDGVVYDSPAAMVQGCDNVLDGRIGDVRNAFINVYSTNILQSVAWTEGYAIIANGSIVQNVNAHYSAIVPISTNKYYKIDMKNTTLSQTENIRIHGYNSEGVWVEQVALCVTEGSNRQSFMFRTTNTSIKGVRVSAPKYVTIYGTGENVILQDQIGIIGEIPKQVYETIGYFKNKPEVPMGSLDGGVTDSGELISSQLTKGFYFECLPNTTYQLVTKTGSQSESGAAHVIAEFTALPEVGSVSTNFNYVTNIPNYPFTITTTANARYIFFDHGLWKSDANLSVYNISSVQNQSLNFNERITELEKEIPTSEQYSRSQSMTAFVWLMNRKAGNLGMMETTFVSPSGLSQYNVSSPRDLFRMGLEVVSNEKAIYMFGIPEKDYTIYGNQRTLTIPNAGYNLLETDFVPYYPVLGNKTGSLGIDGLKRSAIILTEIENQQVMLTIMVSGSYGFDNIWKAAKEVADMVKTQINGGTPEEGEVLQSITGGYVAGIVPNIPGAFTEMVDANYVSSRSDVIKRDVSSELTPASVSKVMTMLCAIDIVPDLKGTKVVIQSDDIEVGSGSTYQSGDMLSLYDAICIMISESSNTMAQAIARTVGNIYLNQRNKIEH